MANEIRGDLSEIALIIALETIGYKYARNIWWHKTPTTLKVCESDITLGKDPENPSIIFQVSSSGYEGGYQKKFWRDMGELIEIRRVFPQCRVISVLFEPGAKEKLRKVYDFVSDGVIDVSNIEGGVILLSKISSLAEGKVPKQLEDKLAFVRKNLGQRPLESLGNLVRACLKRPLNDWELEHHPNSAKAKSELNFRRAILVAALFANEGEMDSIETFLQAAEKGSRLPNAAFLYSLSELGICTQTIGKSFRIVDENLIRCIREVGVERFIRIAKESLGSNKKSRVFTYVRIVQRLPQLLPVWFDAILKNYTRFCDVNSLAKALVDNYSEHDLFLDKTINAYEPWIFRRLLDLIRAADGKHFAIGIPRFDPVFKTAGLPALRFTISDYIAGRRPLTEQEAYVASTVLVPELKRIKTAVTPNLFEQFQIMVRRSEFQQRLITYRGFDPLPIILKEHFVGGTQTVVPEVVRHLGIQGAATCDAYLGENEISMWQSASKHGVAHKVKEMVGRMGLCCLKVNIEKPTTARFTFVSQWKNRVLYIDGSWGQREVNAVLAGCITEIRQLM